MDDATARSLLRRFEPVLCFNRGERFFPLDAGRYVEGAGLWERPRRGAPRRLAPPGSLTLDTLADAARVGTGGRLFLRWAEPLGPAELAAHLVRQRRGDRDPRDVFRAGRGRLARVGYTARFLDAFLSLSLLARGRVPGDLATAAAIVYADLRETDPVPRYHGRVVVRDGWIVLQYWLLYAFNDWRSHFLGTNDHEGDWEMISVLLDADAPDGPRPEWIACTCHERSGADLRRRWDDPELERRGDHPVVRVAAGSHAGYVSPGEYLAEIELPFVRSLSVLRDFARRVWTDALRQWSAPPGEEAHPDDEPSRPGIRVPLVDYARGDGRGIGAGEDMAWGEPVLLTPPPSWVTGYRGLWGYDAGDPLSGEDAPSGPMVERDGTVRRAWRDPVGWCGLDGTPPPSRAEAVAAALRAEIEARRAERVRRADADRAELERRRVERRAIADVPSLAGRRAALREAIARLEQALDGHRARIAEDDDALAAIDTDALRRRDGARGGPRSHLRRPARPIPREVIRAGRIAEAWAAVSVSVLLIGVVALVAFAREWLAAGLAALAFGLLAIEATLRGWLTRLVTGTTISLAVVAGIVLVSAHAGPIALAILVGVGAYMLWENLRELWT